MLDAYTNLPLWLVPENIELLSDFVPIYLAVILAIQPFEHTFDAF